MKRHNRCFAMGFLLTCAPFTAATAETLAFELLATSADTFARPHDIVLSPDKSQLYVADNGNNRIVVLDPQSLAELGTFGEGEVAEPHDVVFTPDGYLLVADTGNSRIAIYTVDGTGGALVNSLNEGLRRPEGVAVDADGRILATGSSSGNLVVYQDGKVVAETGGFSSPHDVEVDASGGIWVADAANDRVVRLSQALEIAAVLTGAPYSFNGPRYLDFDSSGRLYVADKYSHQIKIVAPDGTLVHVLGNSTSGKGEGLFDRPEGVEILGDQVWLSDTYNDRIVLYRVASGP